MLQLNRVLFKCLDSEVAPSTSRFQLRTEIGQKLQAEPAAVVSMCLVAMS